MTKPEIEIIKEYPKRGRLSRFRFKEVIPFDCIECNKSKVSKNMAIIEDDWNKKICNACYGFINSKKQ